jgi:hypothetical protein
MIDSLKLDTIDFRIGSDAQMQLKPSRIMAHTGEKIRDYPLWKNDRGEFRGEGGFHNSEFCGVTVDSHLKSYGHVATLKVAFSAPKVLRGGNYLPTDEEDTRAAVRRIQKHLKDSDIHCNLKEAQLARVHLCKREQVSEPFRSFTPLFRNLHPSRLKPRDWGTTYSFRNTRFEVEFYDKIAEMRYQKVPVETLPQLVMTCEMKFEKSQKVVETLGFETTNDLLNNFDHARNVYRDSLQKRIFQHKAKDVHMVTVKSMENQMSHFVENGVRYWFSAWKDARALSFGIEDYNAAMEAIDNLSVSRNSKYNAKQQLKSAWYSAQAFNKLYPSRRPIRELYDELKTKFALSK